YQGDFEDFAPVEIIGKCILISRVYYKCKLLVMCRAIKSILMPGDRASPGLSPINRGFGGPGHA
ncbi:hypothetical protein J4G02_22925, partial [Candidatus Poribacteria bacterium]|nr:hypothetical protein [Candidatus Poribacteria bacterium]